VRERLTAEHLGANALECPVLLASGVGGFFSREADGAATLVTQSDRDCSSRRQPVFNSRSPRFPPQAANSCAQFSTLIADLLKPRKRAEEGIGSCFDCEFLRQMEFTLQSNAPEQEAIAKANFVLGSGGRNGGVMQAV